MPKPSTCRLYFLNKFAEHFNLGRVEGKQKILGESGAKWEIDSKGIKDNETGFLLIECRRDTNRRIDQGYVGRVAFSIRDTGAQWYYRKSVRIPSRSEEG